MTPDQRFVLGPLPDHPRVTLSAGGCGRWILCCQGVVAVGGWVRGLFLQQHSSRALSGRLVGSAQCGWSHVAWAGAWPFVADLLSYSLARMGPEGMHWPEGMHQPTAVGDRQQP